MSMDPSNFSDVDRSANPSFYLNYLDTVSQIQQFQDYKRRSIELLALQEGQKVLDVGCGTGTDTRLLAGIVTSKGMVVGLDSSRQMITEAQRQAREASLEPTVKYCLGDAHSLPFRSDTFDATRADRVFQHLRMPLAALLELKRVTKVGGHVAVSEPDWESVAIYPGDRSITRRILNHHCDQLEQGWIGRQLVALFTQVELHQIQILPVVICLTDYALVNQMVDLAVVARLAVEAGVVTSLDAERWLSALSTASEERCFFFSITGYIVQGRKMEAERLTLTSRTASEHGTTHL